MKKVLAFLIVLFLPFISLEVKAETEKHYISPEKNALLVDAGVEILKEDIILEYNGRSISGSDVQIAIPTEGLTVTDTGIKASAPGKYRFLLQYEALSMYVYVFAKNEADTEYVLFDSSFTYENGTLPEDFKIVSGNAAVSNNQFKVDGKGGTAMVLLPEYLNGFNNYIIETDFTISEANEPTRWASVLFRYRPKNYFQMAIRQNATLTNGVEFAKAINNQWNVPKTTSHSEAINPSKMYRLKIEVLGSQVKEYIDGELLIEYDQAIDFKYGLIGMQANGSIAIYDNFKVTLPESYNIAEGPEFKSIAEVYEPNTKIVNPPTILTKINSVNQVNGYLNGKRPATAILNMDANFNVLNADGATLNTLEEMLTLFDGQMIPALETEDVEIAKLFAGKLKDYAIVDFFIISSNSEVIIEARKINNITRGILKIDTIPEKLIDIRSNVNSAQAIAVLLNSEVVTKEIVHYLQQRLVTVFVKGDSVVERERALLSGANGIYTNEPIELINRYEEVTVKTHIREVFFIAHRGLHNGYNNSLGPENSLEVAKAAYERGAKIVEIDVHLLADGEVLVMHDDTTNRTAVQGFKVSESFLEYATRIKLKDVSNTGKEFYIPSFQAFLDEFKDKDVVLFVEIKPTNRDLLVKVDEMIDEMDMYDQVVLIMFGAQNALLQQEVSPTMSNGHLVSGLMTDDLNQSLMSIITDVVPLKTTFNPNYGGLTEEIVRGLNHRGITVWPWTVDNLSLMSEFYSAGVGGITTNNMDLVKDNLINLEFELEKLTFKLNDKNSLVIDGILLALDTNSYPYRGELVLVDDGGTDIEFEGNKITGAKKEGKAYFYIKATTEFSDGKTYERTSPLFEVEVVKPKTDYKNIVLYISIGVIVLAAAGGVAFGVIKLRGGKK